MALTLSTQKVFASADNLLARYRPSSFSKGTPRFYYTNIKGNDMSLEFSSRQSQGPDEIPLFWYPEVVSTMDSARDLLLSNELNSNSAKLFGVMANSQTGGRGTRGRKWIEGNGNLYLTLVLDKSLLPSTLPLTLVPLRIGTLLYPVIRRKVSADVPVHLKWPNDILADNKKVCGILIELENDRLLIGIGLNVMAAPSIPSDVVNNADAGRPSTCLLDHNPLLNANCGIGKEQNEGIEGEVCTDGSRELGQSQLLEEIAQEIGTAINGWIYRGSSDSASNVVNEFTNLMQKSPQRLKSSGGVLGAEVLPLSVNADGSLLVRYVETGSESSLLSDYLW